MGMKAFERPDIRKIRNELGFNSDLMGVVVEASSRTVDRWEKNGIPDEAPPQLFGRISRIQELTQLGLMVYSPENFKRFLRTPLPAFGGKSAYQLMLIGEIEQVISELAADYEGAGF
jgi:DNA-binding XRE family transcriptional regulator